VRKTSRNIGAGGVVQAVECLPSKHEALSSNPRTVKKNHRHTSLDYGINCIGIPHCGFVVVQTSSSTPIQTKRAMIIVGDITYGTAIGYGVIAKTSLSAYDYIYIYMYKTIHMMHMLTKETREDNHQSQEDPEFEVSLSHLASLCLKTPGKKRK
jgi:hypothetical protein